MTSSKLAAVLALSLVPSAAASSIKDMRSRSDAVVIVRSAECAIGDTGLRATLTVERSTLDALPPDSVIYASRELERRPVQTTSPEVLPRGVWFLKQEESGWAIVPVGTIGVGGCNGFFFPLPKGALSDPRDLQSNEALTLAAARAFLASGLHPFLWRHMLGREDSSNVREFLRELVDSSDTPTHLVGLTQLLLRGDVEALRSLKKHRDFSHERRNQGLANAVPSAVDIYFRNPEPEAIQLLGEFSNDATLPTNLRQAAAMALSAMHTADSLPYLAKMLDDPNPKLRERGVIGLSFFANGVGIQGPYDGPSMPHLNNRSPTAYRTEETSRYLGFDAANETEWIAFWKAWWLEHQFEFR